MGEDEREREREVLLVADLGQLAGLWQRTVDVGRVVFLLLDDCATVVVGHGVRWAGCVR